LFRRIALAIPSEGAIALSTLNLDTGEFSRTEWSAMRERLEARQDHRSSSPLKAASAALLEMPRFGEGGEQEWLIVELNVDYVRDNVLPELLKKYVGNSGRLDYDWDLVTDPSDTASPADASVALLNIQPRGPDNGRGGPGPPRPFPDRSGRGGRPEPRGDRGPPPNFSSPGWLDLCHHAGSLEAFVAQAKRRNVAASVGLLLLILPTVFALLRATLQSQRLAAAQMNFVASVSHELRTPLSVIRTAAFNLKRSIARRPEQVEQYGQLIQEQAEKLTALVEQVLRFARTESGHVIGKREPVRVDELIEDTLQFGEPLEGKGITIEKNLQADLPPVLADRLAMKHALQNLIENAVKYGDDWVGVSASAMAGRSVEIRVAHRGPGIPDDEQPLIFDPFFRGRRALSDQGSD